jgi:hypothetical protein
MRIWLLTLAVAALVPLAAGCGSGDGPPAQGDTATATTEGSAVLAALPQGADPVTLRPADFVRSIDNPYWPMAPGSRWVYSETDAEGNEQRVEVTVTHETKTIVGIEATVVHDVVSENGQVVEDTYDWYAQDTAGNIWYLGEDTKEYENGQVKSTAGSWEAGVDGAQAGILVPAAPTPGLAYRQEYYAGEAEDAAEVVSVDETADVPYGSFTSVLMTEDSTPLDPQLVEHKYYARGVGPVLAVTVSGGSGREELVTFEPAP